MYDKIHYKLKKKNFFSVSSTAVPLSPPRTQACVYACMRASTRPQPHPPTHTHLEFRGKWVWASLRSGCSWWFITCLSILEPLQRCLKWTLTLCCRIIVPGMLILFGGFKLQKHRTRNANKNQAAGLQQVKRWPNPSPAGRPRAVGCSLDPACTCIRGQRTSLPGRSDPSFCKGQTCEYTAHGEVGRGWHTLRCWKTLEIEIPQECY